MELDPAALAMILQLGGGMTGKPGSQLSAADFTRYFSPELAGMTGTYQDRSESDEDIFARVAPNFRQIASAGESEGYDPIALAIVRNLENGIPNLQTKKKLRELTSELSKEEKEDYLDLFDSLTKEYASVNEERVKNKNKETVFSKGGFDEPGAPYNPESQMGGINAYISDKYLSPIESSQDSKERLAGLAALQKINKDFDAPYKYGGRPSAADVGQMGLDYANESLTKKIPGTPFYNPLGVFEAPVSYLGGIIEGTAKNKIGVDLTKIQERKDAYVKAKILESMDKPDEKKAEAIFKRLKNAPINVDAVNERRATKAVNMNRIAQELITKQMQRDGAGSPFLDQLKQRVLFTKIIENPGLLSKFKTSGS